MKDELDKFIIKNRGQFDQLVPGNELWDKIENDLHHDERSTVVRRSYGWIWKVAAIVFMILNIGLWFQLSNQKEDTLELVAADDFDSELHEVEAYYIGLIQEKRKEINNFLEKSSIEGSEFINDLDALDILYNELKNDLKKNSNNDKLINAMIQNLQLRVEILNKQLNILEQIKNYEEDVKISI